MKRLYKLFIQVSRYDFIVAYTVAKDRLEAINLTDEAYPFQEWKASKISALCKVNQEEKSRFLEYITNK